MVEYITMTERFEPADADLPLASLFAGWALTDEVTRRMAARGFTGLRFSHGFLVQRLIDSEQAIAALAQALDVTQQAVSKTVAELEGLGYVRWGEHPAYARVGGRTIRGLFYHKLLQGGRKP